MPWLYLHITTCKRIQFEHMWQTIVNMQLGCNIGVHQSCHIFHVLMSSWGQPRYNSSNPCTEQRMETLRQYNRCPMVRHPLCGIVLCRPNRQFPNVAYCCPIVAHERDQDLLCQQEREPSILGKQSQTCHKTTTHALPWQWCEPYALNSAFVRHILGEGHGIEWAKQKSLIFSYFVDALQSPKVVL